MASRACVHRAITVALVPIATMLACTSYSGVEKPEAGAEPGPSGNDSGASVADAAIDAPPPPPKPEGVDAGQEAGKISPAVLLNEGFEPAPGAEPSCGAGWVKAGPTSTAVISSTSQHGGSSSCRVCVAGATGGSFGIVSPGVPVQPGRRYLVQAFLRRESPATPIAETLLELVPDEGVPIAPKATSFTDTAWTSVSFTRTVESVPVGTRIRVVFSFKSGGPDCVYVDDVVITELP